MASMGPLFKASVGHDRPSFLLVGNMWWALSLPTSQLLNRNHWYSHIGVCISNGAHFICDIHYITNIKVGCFAELRHHCPFDHNQLSRYIVDCLQAMVSHYILWYQWQLLILIRNHRKATSSLGLKRQQSRVQNVMFLLVESGVFFLGLQVSFCLFSCTYLCHCLTVWLIMC